MAKTPRQPRSDQTLEPFARRFLPYEITQLVGTAELLSGKITISLPLHSAKPLYNSLLEAFLIHLRCLDDFLGASSHQRDVLAIDFLDTWEATPILEESERQAVNAQLAHLSINRKSGPEHPWPVVRLADDAVGGLGAFLRELDKDGRALASKWANAIRPTHDWAQNKVLELEAYSDEQFHT